jgi:hypothetical protein
MDHINMTLEQEITTLTEKWYRYVNLDHHKDRDCHWYIEKRYSYGDEPYYQAFHHGYIIDDWSSPKCDTLEAAETMMVNKLKREIQEAITHLKDVLIDADALEWFGSDKEKVHSLIDELQVDFKI